MDVMERRRGMVGTGEGSPYPFTSDYPELNEYGTFLFTVVSVSGSGNSNTYIQSDTTIYQWTGDGDRGRQLKVAITNENIAISYWINSQNKWVAWITKAFAGFPVKIKRCNGRANDAPVTTFVVNKVESVYVLGQGSVTTQSYTVTVIGNHVKFDSVIAAFNSMTPLGHSTSTVDSQPLWFSIPSGSVCSLRFLNMRSTLTHPVAMNFRKAGATTSLGFGTGNFDSTLFSEKIVNVTTTEANNVGSLFLYAQNSSGGTLEFDVELYVDGVRWL